MIVIPKTSETVNCNQIISYTERLTVDVILWCYHSNENSMADLFYGTIYFLWFCKKKNWKLLGGRFA